MEPRYRVDTEAEPPSVRTLYPRPEYWKTREDKLEARRELIQDRVSKQPETVLVHDRDCDGLGTAVMVRYEHSDASLIPRGHGEEDVTVPDVGHLLANHVDQGTRVIIADLGLTVDDDETPVEAVEEYVTWYQQSFEQVYIYDHHQWPQEARDWLAAQDDIEFAIDDDTEDDARCAALVVHDEYVSTPSTQLTEFAKLTNDHDLWIKEDPRSDDLASYAGVATTEQYVEDALRDGVALLETKDVQARITDSEKRRRERINIGLRRAEFHDVADKTLAVVYGRYPKSGLGHALLSETDADCSCMLKPSGGLSFRSDDGESAQLLAEAFNGGGHADAAGGWMRDILVQNDEETMEAYWGSHGQSILDPFLTTAESAFEQAD